MRCLRFKEKVKEIRKIHFKVDFYRSERDCLSIEFLTGRGETCKSAKIAWSRIEWKITQKTDLIRWKGLKVDKKNFIIKNICENEVNGELSWMQKMSIKRWNKTNVRICEWSRLRASRVEIRLFKRSVRFKILCHCKSSTVTISLSFSF